MSIMRDLKVADLLKDTNLMSEINLKRDLPGLPAENWSEIELQKQKHTAAQIITTLREAEVLEAKGVSMKTVVFSCCASWKLN